MRVRVYQCRTNNNLAGHKREFLALTAFLLYLFNQGVFMKNKSNKEETAMQMNYDGIGTGRLDVMNSASMRSLIMRRNERNIRKLEQLGILDKFVKENNGTWDHHTWVDLCELIEKQNLGPIDFERVGLIIEGKKAELLFSRQMTCEQPEHANFTT